MAKFWVDYEASILIEAEDKDEAKEIFYQCYLDETRRYAEIKAVEEKTED